MGILDKFCRPLLDRSLRKSSEELQRKVDAYRQEWERCRMQAEYAREEQDRKFDAAKLDMMKELSKDVEFYDGIREDLAGCIDLFFRQERLGKIKNAKDAEEKQVREGKIFLSQTMNAIGEEIVLLEERKNILSSQVYVDDILELLQMSGNDLAIRSDLDARSLYCEISRKISDCDSLERSEKNALQQLRALLEERVAFVSEIEYIEWVIRQKKQISFQCRQRRDDAERRARDCRAEIEELQSNWKDCQKQLQDRKKKLRLHWEEPIAQLSCEILNLEKSSETQEWTKINERLAALYHNEESERQMLQYERKSKELRGQFATG